MNKKLKAAIVARYGSQSDFAQVVGVNEAIVSRIIRGRRELPEEEKVRWAAILQCGKEDFQNG